MAPKLIKKNGKRFIEYKGKRYVLNSPKSDKEIIGDLVGIIKGIHQLKRKRKLKRINKTKQLKSISKSKSILRKTRKRSTRSKIDGKKNAPNPESTASGSTSTPIPDLAKIAKLSKPAMGTIEWNVQQNNALEAKKAEHNLLYGDKGKAIAGPSGVKQIEAPPEKGKIRIYKDDGTVLEGDVDRYKEYAVTEKENEDLKKMIDKGKQILIQLEKESKDKEKELRRANNEVIYIQNDITKLKQNLASEKHKGELTQKELEKKTEEIEKLEEKKDELNDELQQQKDDLDDLQRRMKTAQTNLSINQTQLSNASIRNIDLQDAMNKQKIYKELKKLSYKKLTEMADAYNIPTRHGGRNDNSYKRSADDIIDDLFLNPDAMDELNDEYEIEDPVSEEKKKLDNERKDIIKDKIKELDDQVDTWKKLKDDTYKKLYDELEDKEKQRYNDIKQFYKDQGEEVPDDVIEENFNNLKKIKEEVSNDPRYIAMESPYISFEDEKRRYKEILDKELYKTEKDIDDYRDEIDDLDELLELLPDNYYDSDSGGSQGGAGVGDNTGLWNYEIEELMKPYHKKGFKGVYSIDQINEISFDPKKEESISFIVNTSPSTKKDGHWIGVYLTKDKLEYYDSFAEEPSNTMKRRLIKLAHKWQPDNTLQFKINRIKYQRANSNNCGYFAIRFLQDRYNGKNFKDATGFTKLSQVIKGEKEIRAFKNRIVEFGHI